MSPNPEEQNPWERNGANSDGSDDGWHVGYEVEMHAIGIEEYTNSEDDVSDAKSDSCDESDENRYSGYLTLPTSDGSFEVDADRGHTGAVAQKDFKEVLSSENGNFNIEFGVAKSIELTEDKIEHIKKMMSTLNLPAPSWAKGIDSDSELKKLLEKLKSK
ncbi:unnamed protein product [Litomosoides sigmodontis]|uniref:Male-enhanced antigen 1 n=1 Tax=Litomosoides sigmodontis TaxID=42156 RepID=A0A3P6UBC6_LITSI|nr:unnamed protein product [Litomosoides sigmodontis]